MDFLEETSVPAEGPPPAEWDPPEEQRSYFRHMVTGDLGYLVRRGGKNCVRYDRPTVDQVVTFDPGSWRKEETSRPMSDMQKAKVLHWADRGLCRALGDYGRANKEWESLRDEERIAWRDQGPKGPAPRVALYRAIKQAISEL